MTVRGALGASRSRIARQLLAESLVLTTLGTAAGVAIAWWTLDLLSRESSVLDSAVLQHCARLARAGHHGGRLHRDRSSLWPLPGASGIARRSRARVERRVGQYDNRVPHRATRALRTRLGGDGAGDDAARGRGPVDREFHARDSTSKRDSTRQTWCPWRWSFPGPSPTIVPRVSLPPSWLRSVHTASRRVSSSPAAARSWAAT